jgi:tyrosyl-tRNA synthetase
MITIPPPPAQIGDPSGRTSERTPMTLDEIRSNISGLCANLEAVFSNHETFVWNESKINREAKLKPVKIVNNLDWYNNVNLLQFLRDYGRHFRYTIFGSCLSLLGMVSFLS